MPLYRAGEAGSFERNFGIRKEVPCNERRSFTLSRRDVDFVGSRDVEDMVGGERMRRGHRGPLL